MEHRGYFSSPEREARSKLAKLVHQKPFLQGSIVKRISKRGKNNCWRAKEDGGHAACYLAARIGKKRKMIYISQAFEKDAREWVTAYRQINKQISEISKYCLQRIKGE